MNKHQVPAATDWFNEQNHDLIPSFTDIDLLKPEPEYLPNWFLMFRPETTGELTSPPKHMLELSLNEGNFWQLRERNDANGDPRAAGLQNGVFRSLGSSCISLEHVQNDRDKFVLGASLINGGVSGSFTYETMPCRHRGHAIEPGGPLLVVDAEFVEQRYKAHCVQNSWSQPT